MHPELFEIPFVHLTVTSYGVMMVVGFLAAVTLIRRLSRDFTPDPRHITNAALYALIAGVVGARVFFVVHYWHHFQGRSPIAMFAIWQGGLELIGGVVLAIVIIFFYLLWHKLPARRYLDSLAVGLMLALLFGRIGCLLNGCCYGKPTTVFWGIRFPYGSAPYRSQVYPDPARDRPEPHLKLPDEYFTSVRDFFEVDAKFAAPLDRGILSGGLWSQFERKGFNLSRYSKVRTEQPSTRWLITDDQGRYAISKGSAGSLTVDANVRYLRTYQGLTEAQKAAVTKGQYRCLAVHPTQLYTSAAGGLMCLLLYLFWRRSFTSALAGRPGGFLARPGSVFALMFIFYGVFRFLIEMLRDDNPFERGWWTIYKGGTVSQNLGIYLVIFGLILVVVFHVLKPDRLKLHKPAPKKKR